MWEQTQNVVENVNRNIFKQIKTISKHQSLNIDRLEKNDFVELENQV